MKKISRSLALICLMLLLALGAAYVGLAIYYQNGFTVNTWINGVYCTGHSVTEVNAALLDQTVAVEELCVTAYDKTGSDAGETTWFISMEDIDRKLDYETSLHEYLSEQNSWFWIRNVSVSRNHELTPKITFDESLLKEWWNDVTAQMHPDEKYSIEYDTKTGYVLYDGVNNRLDSDKAYKVILDAITNGESEVNLIAAGCYYDIPMTREQEQTSVLWDKINFYQENGPVYDFGEEKFQLDAGQMALFLHQSAATGMPFESDSGAFLVDDAAVKEWVKKLAEEYDTYGKEWSFQSTRGDVVVVQGVTYGTTIDQDREFVWLENYLKKLACGEMPGEKIRVPEYSKDAYNHSGTTIGDTYVEVDMGIQKLYYYEKGQLKIETDVVTGNAKRKMNTPEGVNYVYNKQKNRVLRGPGYATPVKYWLPVKGAIGLHDATWRDEFGGEIYKTNGSHGCVNIPLDVMAELYDMIEVGTPVVMFYGDDPYDEEAKTM